ncbi:predicted protein [Thalassiosira pseudonana CCMP1335]|uniref:Secreted protein n=1 Tax=Thalassiosira pseudonana TaxID=35128 RepID=B8LDH9_THAPS|nr:predicted protein [Thalassiosira pseudonana CCMP1335]EED86711.1 predicted protein [Thalassiosira pseudonana CCMP1335]
MRVLQLVFTIALLSNQESSGVAALLSPLRERRAKAGKSTNAPTEFPTTTMGLFRALLLCFYSLHQSRQRWVCSWLCFDAFKGVSNVCTNHVTNKDNDGFVLGSALMLLKEFPTVIPCELDLLHALLEY